MRRLLLPEGKGAVAGTPAVAGRGVVDVRRRPSHRAELVSQVTLGTPVRLIASRGEWSRIGTPDGYGGWVVRDALARGKRADRAPRGLPRGVVGTLLSWVREEPRAGAAVLAEVVAGTELPLIGSRGSWWQVLLPAGERGWLPHRILEPLSARSRGWPARSRIARRALSFRGCPYLWGGTTPKGFDCSGFVQTVFRLEGLLLPRDAWQQEHVAASLSSAEEPAAGDLAFFGTRLRRITHVGVCLGEGLFIHASGCVKVESLDPGSARYSRTLAAKFLAYGRVLPSSSRPRFSLERS